MNWKDYEIEIYEYFKNMFPNAEISHNVTLTGRYSKTERQIDILIEDYVAGNRMRIIIDGKFFSKKIDVKHVEMFIGMLNDCEANKGLLITQEGYSKAAINRAHFDPIDIELDILNFKELLELQSFGGIIYKDNSGAMVQAPFGWVIDATKRDGMLATFYQRGLSFEEAVSSKEWMYINIGNKDDKINSLDDFIKFQENYILEENPNTKITYLPTIKRDNCAVKLRLLDIKPYAKEYTGFVEFEDFILFCVIFTPEELEKKNIRKMENILQNVIPLNVQKAAGNSGFTQ